MTTLDLQSSNHKVRTLRTKERAKPSIVFKPNDRVCFIGKTRSGKTFAVISLLTVVLPWSWPAKHPWQVWWIDTKDQIDDIARLKRWGFREFSKKLDPNWPRVLFKVRSNDESDPLSVARQVQQICWRAFKRRGIGRYANVLIVIDEYVSCILSKRNAGAGLLEVFQRGGGKHVGLIGGTQEPVDIPRQLSSQATHIFLMHLTHPPDIEWANKICPIYGEGPADDYGFFYKWVDGPVEFREWLYFRDISEFMTRFKQYREESSV